MNPIIENTERQFLTKRANVGLIKLIVPALIVTICGLFFVPEASATDITSNITLTKDTTIENISGGHSGVSASTINTNGYTLTLNNTEDTHFGGEIMGSGNIVKTGPGTIYFEYQPKETSPSYPADIWYRGTTTISGGTLNLDAMNGLLWWSSQVTNNSVIETNKDQRFNNLSGTGTIIVSSNASLDLNNTGKSEFSGSIVGVTDIDVQGNGSGELTISGTLNDVNSIYVSNRGHLKLTDSGLNYYGPMTTDTGTSVDYCVKNGSKRYDMSANNKINVKGTMSKSGDGTLQICCASAGLVSAESMFISSGRLDYQGYFETSAYYWKDCVVVEDEGILSPGIGVGDMILNHGNLSILDSGIALFEFGAYKEDPSQQTFDTITIAGNNYSFDVNSSSIIQLAFLNGDANSWAEKDAEYHLVYDDGFTDGDYSNLLEKQYRDRFELRGKNGNGLYLIGLGVPEPPTPVPEPSTWALLILGAAGLMYVRKRVRS